MGLGVLEPRSGHNVPGTVLLDQAAAHSEGQTSHLKHGTGRNSNIVLAPQPSEDPNDPLNWPKWKKDLTLGIIFFGVIVQACVPNPILNAGIASVAIALEVTVTDVALLSGYMILTTAAVGPFASAFGRKYGKRPCYVFCSLMGTLGCIICETANSYNMLLAGRILEGIGIAAYESLAVATIGDLYFVHERGPRVAFMMFLLAAISNGISIIAGQITEVYGWHWNFHILAPFAVAQTIAVILFSPETTYRRDAIYETDLQASDQNLEKLAQIEDKARHVENKTIEVSAVELGATRTQSSIYIPPKKTYLQELSLYNGTFVNDPIWKMVLACLAIVFNVGAFYQIVMTGCIIAWYVGVAISGGVIFASPPFLMKPAEIGYMSGGPLLGGFLGAAFCFVTAEPYIKWITRKNKGIYEPEFWLIPVAFDGSLAILGLIGYGYATQRAMSIPFICFTWGLMLFGMTAVSTHCSQWALDSYRSNSTELFVMNMVFKNFFFYGLTNYVIEWWLTQGIVNLCGTAAGITAFLCLLAIPIYFFGKRYRLFWHQHNIIKMLHLETDKTGAE